VNPYLVAGLLAVLYLASDALVGWLTRRYLVPGPSDGFWTPGRVG
jgi:hypothetical protein